MKREEFTELITQSADPDKAPATLQTLATAINDLLTENETLSQQVAEQGNTIATLRDTNMRLFLQQTKPVEETEPEPEKTPDDYMNDIVAMIKGE